MRYQHFANYDVARAKNRALSTTSNAAYREEYQRDHGPDFEEPLDMTESGHEIILLLVFVL